MAYYEHNDFSGDRLAKYAKTGFVAYILTRVLPPGYIKIGVALFILSQFVGPIAGPYLPVVLLLLVLVIFLARAVFAILKAIFSIFR